MKHVMALAFVLTSLVWTCSAQQWWAPGACWIYQAQLLSQALHIYTYTGDTVIDGYVTQRCHYRYCDVFPPDTFCYGSFPFLQYDEFVRTEGDVVYSRTGSQWDTLYYLGVPGDAWYPVGYDMSCAPLSRVTVTDTTYVVVDGVSLRAWDIAQLDANGLPMWNPTFGDTLRVVERIGGSPRYFPFFYCPPDIIDEGQFYSLRHYSDWQISFGTGVDCEVVLRSQELHETLLLMSPNPGTEHFTVSSPSAVSVEVRDALGRLVLNRTRINPGQQVNTEGWPQGTYFVSITTRNGSKQVLRWVKH